MWENHSIPSPEKGYSHNTHSADGITQSKKILQHNMLGKDLIMISMISVKGGVCSDRQRYWWDWKQSSKDCNYVFTVQILNKLLRNITVIVSVSITLACVFLYVFYKLSFDVPGVTGTAITVTCGHPSSTYILQNVNVKRCALEARLTPAHLYVYLPRMV